MRAARLSQGLTMAHVAEALDVDLGTVENWERSRTEPRCSQLRKFAKVVGCNALDLFRSVLATPDDQEPSARAVA